MSGARPAQPPASPAPDRPGMPPSVRVSIVLLAVLAALLLSSALLTWGGREGVGEQYLRSQPAATRADADRLVMLNVVQGLVFGVLAAVSALALTRRYPWGRWRAWSPVGCSACSPPGSAWEPAASP